MNYRERQRWMQDFAARSLSKHVLAPADTKSWKMRNPERSEYWFTVTWSHPGILSIGGDMGDLTITHYHAMPTWFDALRWLEGCDFGYHLEKSSAKKVYDEEGSVEDTMQIVKDMDEYERTKFFDKLIKDRVIDAETSRNDEAEMQAFHEAVKDAAAGGEDNFYRFLSNECDWVDTYPSRDYEQSVYAKMQAIYYWAAAVRQTEEYKAEIYAREVRAALRENALVHDRRMKPRSRYSSDDYSWSPGVTEAIKWDMSIGGAA